MTRPPSFFISITHCVSIKTADKCEMLKAYKCLLKTFGVGFWIHTHTHVLSQILVNRQIHFHTKSASISEALKATRAAMIWSHACYFLTFSNKQIRCLSASLVLWSQQAQSTSVPNWAKSIRFQFVIFSWEWASNNSSRKNKINIANEIRHLMFSSRGTLISTLRRHWCLASTARGWQTVWIGSTNTFSVVLLPKIIWHFCIRD